MALKDGSPGTSISRRLHARQIANLRLLSPALSVYEYWSIPSHGITDAAPVAGAKAGSGQPSFALQITDMRNQNWLNTRMRYIFVTSGDSERPVNELRRLSVIDQQVLIDCKTVCFSDWCVEANRWSNEMKKILMAILDVLLAAARARAAQAMRVNADVRGPHEERYTSNAGGWK
jgi:hypothetical protein